MEINQSKSKNPVSAKKSEGKSAKKPEKAVKAPAKQKIDGSVDQQQQASNVDD